jgi:hypothetical protein
LCVWLNSLGNIKDQGCALTQTNCITIIQLRLIDLMLIDGDGILLCDLANAPDPPVKDDLCMLS